MVSAGTRIVGRRPLWDVQEVSGSSLDWGTAAPRLQTSWCAFLSKMNLRGIKDTNKPTWAWHNTTTLHQKILRKHTQSSNDTPKVSCPTQHKFMTEVPVLHIRLTIGPLLESYDLVDRCIQLQYLTYLSTVCMISVHLSTRSVSYTHLTLPTKRIV